MKKLLSLTTITILSNTAITNLTNTKINANQVNNVSTINIFKNENNNSKIDWNNIEIKLDNLFDNYRQKTNLLKTGNDKVTNEDIAKALKFAQAKSNEYLANFKNNGFTLNQVINTLSNDNANFKACYDKSLHNMNQQGQINSKLSNNNALFYNSSLKTSNNEDINSLKEQVRNLKIQKVTFATMSAITAVAAVGFWAASPWCFGATTPWAVGCTEISVVTGFASAIMSLAIITTDQEMPGWEKATSAFTSGYFIGHIFYKLLYPVLISLNAVITATSWVFPAVLALLTVTGAILAWISLYS